MECPFCKKTNIDTGLIKGGYRIGYFSDIDKEKLFKNYIPIEAFLCKDCGMIFLKKENK
jgi:hypothetical protein